MTEKLNKDCYSDKFGILKFVVLKQFDIFES